jgi:hypothetical protein
MLSRADPDVHPKYLLFVIISFSTHRKHGLSLRLCNFTGRDAHPSSSLPNTKGCDIRARASPRSFASANTGRTYMIQFVQATRCSCDIDVSESAPPSLYRVRAEISEDLRSSGLSLGWEVVMIVKAGPSLAEDVAYRVRHDQADYASAHRRSQFGSQGNDRRNPR